MRRKIGLFDVEDRPFALPVQQSSLVRVDGTRQVQRGRGIVKDVRNFLGDRFADYGYQGVDYLADRYGHGGVDYVANKIRGKGFFRSLAGNAVKGIGNLVGDTIKGGSVKGAGVRRRRKTRKAKSRKATGGRIRRGAVNAHPDLYLQGNGFFRSLAGNAVKGIGNLVGDTIKGGRVKRKRKGTKKKTKKRRTRKRVGAGIYHPGMYY